MFCRNIYLHNLMIPFYYNYPFLQNKLENINTINKIVKEDMDIIKNNTIQLTKEKYINIVRVNRKKFVHKLFNDILTSLFEEMSKAAKKMRPCHHEAKFPIPDHYDINKMENVLIEYFKDIGYTSIPEPRKENTQYNTIEE